MQISEHHSIVAGKGRSLLNINPRTETILTCSGKFFTEVDIHSNAVICRQILPFAPTDMFVAQSGTLLIFFDGTATFHCMQKHGPSLRLLSRLRLSSSFEKLRPFQMAVSPIEAKLAIVYPHSNKLLLLSLLHTISDKKKGTLLKPTIFTVKHDKDLICVAFHPSRPIFITSSSDTLSGDSKNRAVYRCIAVSRSDIKPRSSQTKSGFGAFEVGSAAVPDLLAVGDTSGKLWCWNISDPKAPVFAGARRIDPTHSLVHISFSPSSETCSMIIMADDGSCQSYAYSSPDTLRDADGALIPPPTKMDDYSGIMKSDILVPFSIPVSKSTAPPNTPKALHFPLFRTPPIQFHDSSDIILIPAKQKNTLYTYSHSFHTAVQPLVVITSYPVSFFFNPQPFPDRGLITPTEIAHPVVNIPELSSIAECSNEATLPSLDVLLRASAFPINPTIPFFSSFGQFSLYFYNSQRTVPSQVLPPLLTVDLPGSQAGTPKPGQKPASRQIRLHPIRVQGSLFHPYVLVLLEAVSSQQTIGWESVVYFAVVKPPSALTPDEEMEAFDPSVVQQNMPCVLIPPTPCRDATFVGPNNDTNVAAITVDGAMLSLYSFALPTPEQLAGVKKGLCPLVFKKEWSQPLPTISDRFFSTPMGGGSCLLYHETTNGNRLVLSAGAAQWCVKGHRTRLLRSSSRIAPMSRFTSFASTPAAHSQTTSLITVGFSNVTEYLPPRGSFVVRPVATGDSDIVEEKVGEIVLQSEEIPLSVEWVRLPADPTVTWDDHEEKTKGEPIITQIANKQDVQIRAIGAIMTTLRIIIVDSTLHVLKTITRTEHSCPPMYNKAIPYFTSIKWVSTALFYTTPNHLFFTTISPAIEPLLVAPFPYTNAGLSLFLFSLLSHLRYPSRPSDRGQQSSPSPTFCRAHPNIHNHPILNIHPVCFVTCLSPRHHTRPCPRPPSCGLCLLHVPPSHSPRNLLPITLRSSTRTACTIHPHSFQNEVTPSVHPHHTRVRFSLRLFPLHPIHLCHLRWQYRPSHRLC
ncbi:hypothetical protein BLNAU_2380 [Blattamonas nauphoetae]|uniref:Uncharacterized protein n=1 Tax=Blattamonas nauphoetae TaxID=2049346 RepID=A0ABQ9YFJ7_9EUKA|nr:hypothetical protein BLNAU_2380 [Blattamonas nauphoetae]